MTEIPPVTPHDAVAVLIASEPVSVDEKLTLRSVAAVLRADAIGAALVRRNGEPVGIVSERDVVRALADDADPDTVWSADVMSEELVMADGDDAILQVALQMIDAGIRHIAVEHDHRIIGVVSSRDVFRVLAEDALEAG